MKKPRNLAGLYIFSRFPCRRPGHSVHVDNGKMIQLVFDDPDKFSAFELSLYPFSPGSCGGSFSFNYMAEAGYAFTNDLSFTGRASLPYSPVEDTPRPQRDPAAEVSLFEYSIIGHYNVFSFSPDMHLIQDHSAYFTKTPTSDFFSRSFGCRLRLLAEGSKETLSRTITA